MSLLKMNCSFCTVSTSPGSLMMILRVPFSWAMGRTYVLARDRLGHQFDNGLGNRDLGEVDELQAVVLGDGVHHLLGRAIAELDEWHPGARCRFAWPPPWPRRAARRPRIFLRTRISVKSPPALAMRVSEEAGSRQSKKLCGTVRIFYAHSRHQKKKKMRIRRDAELIRARTCLVRALCFREWRTQNTGARKAVDVVGVGRRPHRPNQCVGPMLRDVANTFRGHGRCRSLVAKLTVRSFSRFSWRAADSSASERANTMKVRRVSPGKPHHALVVARA